MLVPASAGGNYALSWRELSRPRGRSLLPLADEPFATGITLTLRVERYGMITEVEGGLMDDGELGYRRRPVG